MLDRLTNLAPNAVPVAVFFLVLVGVGALLVALALPQLTGGSATRRRLEAAAGGEIKAARGGTIMTEQRRKQSIEKALTEMAQRERAKQRAKMTLRMRLGQAGIAWSTMQFHAFAVIAGSVAALVLWLVVGLDIYFAVPAGGLLGFVGMNLYVKARFKSRMRKFVDEFPNAIDIVTRGVKTGLPLSDCLKAIANEGQEPVKGEFRRVVDDTAVGLTLGQALDRFTHRVPIMEANFFAVVVAIQSQLGGNLSEALGNLSRVLRERKMMKQKIKAFSSEATASGAIIASMPVVVAGILSLTSPDYIALLFTEFAGNVVLAGSAVWMTAGVIVMRNMIRFDF